MKNFLLALSSFIIFGCTQNDNTYNGARLSSEPVPYSDENIIIKDGDDYRKFDTVSFFISPDIENTSRLMRSKIINFADYVGERNAVSIVNNNPSNILKIQSNTGCEFDITNKQYSFLFLINSTNECISGSFELYSSAQRTFELINTMIDRKEICYVENAENSFIELVEKAGEPEQSSIISLGSKLIRSIIGSGFVDCNL